MPFRIKMILPSGETKAGWRDATKMIRSYDKSEFKVLKFLLKFVVLNMLIIMSYFVLTKKDRKISFSTNESYLSSTWLQNFADWKERIISDYKIIILISWTYQPEELLTQARRVTQAKLFFEQQTWGKSLCHIIFHAKITTKTTDGKRWTLRTWQHIRRDSMSSHP